MVAVFQIQFLAQKPWPSSSCPPDPPLPALLTLTLLFNRLVDWSWIFKVDMEVLWWQNLIQVNKGGCMNTRFATLSGSLKPGIHTNYVLGLTAPSCLAPMLHLQCWVLLCLTIYYHSECRFSCISDLHTNWFNVFVVIVVFIFYVQWDQQCFTTIFITKT